MSPAPQEASADSRTFARSVRDLYVAMLAEGFTRSEALELLARIVQSAMFMNGGKS